MAVSIAATVGFGRVRAMVCNRSDWLKFTCTYFVLSVRTYEDLYVQLTRLTRLKMKLILNMNIRFGSSEMWIGRGAVRRN